MKRLAESLYQKLFGCKCPDYSFPITREERTYVVCPTCGKEYEYDWERMERMAA